MRGASSCSCSPQTSCRSLSSPLAREMSRTATERLHRLPITISIPDQLCRGLLSTSMRLQQSNCSEQYEARPLSSLERIRLNSKGPHGVSVCVSHNNTIRQVSALESRIAPGLRPYRRPSARRDRGQNLIGPKVRAETRTLIETMRGAWQLVLIS